MCDLNNVHSFGMNVVAQNVGDQTIAVMAQ